MSLATHGGPGWAVNETHDAARRSWVASANEPDTDFRVQNLPLGIFRHNGGPARGVTITRTNFLHVYWTFAQMLTHQTSGGCNLEPGDLLASGTVSGPTDESAACLLEITAGTLPIVLPNGEERCWLEDGDMFVITGRATRDGFVGLGFGTCGATVLPAT